MVEERAQSVDIGDHADLRVASRGLFRGHVAGGTEHLAGQRRAIDGAKHLGQAEVGDARPSVLADKYVGGFQVAVQDAALVRIFYRPGQLPQDFRGPRHGQRSARAKLCEVAAHHQIHRIIGLALAFAVVVDRDNIGMLQTSRGRRLELKPPQRRLARVDTRQQQFHRHGATQRRMARAVHNPHASPAEFIGQFIRPKGVRQAQPCGRSGARAPAGRPRFKHRAQQAAGAQGFGHARVQRATATFARHDAHQAGG